MSRLMQAPSVEVGATIQAERLVMAHRYLYYVLSESVVSDGVYDQLEREARAICPPASPVHGVGSSLPDSYSAEVQEVARSLLDA